jgi:hypothetical protein
MNYASVIFVFVIGCSVGYYYLRARKWFNGPGKSMEPDPQISPVTFDDSFESVTLNLGEKDGSSKSTLKNGSSTKQ